MLHLFSKDHLLPNIHACYTYFPRITYYQIPIKNTPSPQGTHNQCSNGSRQIAMDTRRCVFTNYPFYGRAFTLEIRPLVQCFIPVRTPDQITVVCIGIRALHGMSANSSVVCRQTPHQAWRAVGQLCTAMMRGNGGANKIGQWPMIIHVGHCQTFIESHEIVLHFCYVLV